MKEKDDFWNIERILPPKTQGDVKHKKVETAEVKSGYSLRSDGVDIKSLFASINEKKGINSLESAIKKERDYSHFTKSNVVSSAYVGFYNNSLFYDNKFRIQALSVFLKKALHTVTFSEYFSFKPAYSDLSHKQLLYYLWWRERIREGIFEHATSSYALLLVSEIINLPDKIPPREGIKTLLALWSHYLLEDGKSAKVIMDTVFEYCVVNDIPIPYSEMENVIFRSSYSSFHILNVLFVFDYLLVKRQMLSETELYFLYENILGYSFRSGKHYKSNELFKSSLDKEFYKKLSEFFSGVPRYISEIFDKHKNRTSPVRIIKPAFINISSSAEIKRNIVYEYYPYEKTDIELEQLVNIAKHIENKFRAQCGIKARLATAVLDDESKLILDSLFADTPINGAKDKQTEQISAKKVVVDINAALSIEETSWQTTQMLTDGIDIFNEDKEESVQKQETQDASSIWTEDEISIIKFLLNNSHASAFEYCEKRGIFLESLLIEINEKSVEIFGDIIVDMHSKTVFEEYLNEVYESLS